MKMKCKVIMLPCDKSIIHLQQNTNKLWKFDNPTANSGSLTIPQHLYLISDEEIQVGEYQYFEVDGSILIANEKRGIHPDAKKVVATTNPELNLPLIPQSFVEKYVEVNGNIEEVEIELSLSAKQFTYYNSGLACKSNGTVIISQPKETWTRDEVEQLIIDAVAETADYIEFNNPECAITSINILRKRFLDNWIKNNL